MDSSWNACDILEGLSAEVIAADPSDSDTMRYLHGELIRALGAMDASAPAQNLAQHAHNLADGLAMSQMPDPQAGIAMLAEAINTVAGSCQKPEAKHREKLDRITATINELLATRTTDTLPAQTTEDPLNTPTISSISDLTDKDHNHDDELMAEFVSEGLQHLATAETALLQLESSPHDLDQVNTVLRAFHTIKGASAFLGLETIQHLSHLAESLLSRARDGEILMTGRYTDTALKACDTLKKMVQAVREEGVSSAFTPEGFDALQADLTRQDGDPTANTPAAPVTPAPTPTQCDTVTDTDDEPAHTHAGDSAIRVSTNRLDDLIDMVGELVIAQSIVVQDAELADRDGTSLNHSISHAGKIVRKLQDLAMSLRMVPLKGTFAKMNRVVRDLARKSDKSVRLITHGEDTEIDRNMVESLTDPLIHMIRNAVDHGIESSTDRARRGKPATGTLSLKAFHSAGNVIIELSDDGKGLDREKILTKAIAAGLVPHGADLTEREIFSLIFQPGFSTADAVTEVSGRGVGMDVVKRNLTALHGRIEVTSEPGQGACFRVSLPLTMAITDAMVVTAGDETYLLPTIAIERSFRPEPGSVSNFAGGGQVVSYRDEVLPLLKLHDLFNLPNAVTNPTEALLVLIHGNGRRCALMVDSLVGHQQAVIKSLGEALRGTLGTSGGAILSDGRVGLILDADSLVNLAMGHGHDRDINHAA